MPTRAEGLRSQREIALSAEGGGLPAFTPRPFLTAGQAKRDVLITARGGPLPALGYRPPRRITLTRDQARRAASMLQFSVDPRVVLERVLGLAVGSLTGYLVGGLSEAPGLLGDLGKFLSSTLGAFLGGVESLFGLGGSKPSTVSFVIAGSPPAPVQPARPAPIIERPAPGATTLPGCPAGFVFDPETGECLPAAGVKMNQPPIPPALAAQVGLRPGFAVRRAPALTEAAAPRGQFPSSISRLLGMIGLEQAGEAGIKALRGERLSNEEFGALAGTIIGTLAGDPLIGARVGLTVGQAADELDALSRDLFGRTLDQTLGRPVSSIRPLQTQPQPQEGVIRERPLQVPPPPERLPLREFGDGLRPFERQPEQRPLDGARPRPQDQHPQDQQDGRFVRQPQPDCTTEESEIGQLAKLLINCPTFQNELRDKVTITQRPGQRPTLSIKEPVCLCCDSEGDLQEYTDTGGRSGRCVVVQGAPAELVGIRESGTGLPGVR